MILLADLRLFFIIGLAAVVAAGAVWLLLRRAGVDLSAMLTKSEWRIAWKLAAVVILAIVIVLARISLEYPAEQFIYGRF